MSKQRKMILIAAAVGVISMFLPWYSYLGLGTESGMRGTGILVFICFGAAGVLAFTGNQLTNLNQVNWMITLISGGIAALITAIKLISPPVLVERNFLINEQISSERGLGLYIALIAAIGVISFAFMNRSATDNLQSGFDSLKGDLERRMNSTATNTTSPNITTTPVSNPRTEDDPTRPVV